MTRGERNRNPGNLRDAGIPWQGLIGRDDKGFCIFDLVSNGIRALAKDLLHDFRKENKRTVYALISEFAPPIENDTNAYMDAVAKAMNVGVHDVIDLEKQSVLISMSKAIIKHENGGVIYSDELIAESVRKALA